MNTNNVNDCPYCSSTDLMEISRERGAYLPVKCFTCGATIVDANHAINPPAVISAKLAADEGVEQQIRDDSRNS